MRRRDVFGVLKDHIRFELQSYVLGRDDSLIERGESLRVKEAKKVGEGFRLVVERLRRVAKEPSKVVRQDRRSCRNDCKATGNIDGVFEETSSLSGNIDDDRTNTTGSCGNTASGFEIIRMLGRQDRVFP
jgi:hypothetical protein